MERPNPRRHFVVAGAEIRPLDGPPTSPPPDDPCVLVPSGTYRPERYPTTEAFKRAWLARQPRHDGEKTR